MNAKIIWKHSCFGDNAQVHIGSIYKQDKITCLQFLQNVNFIQTHNLVVKMYKNSLVSPHALDRISIVYNCAGISDLFPEVSDQI